MNWLGQVILAIVFCFIFLKVQNYFNEILEELKTIRKNEHNFFMYQDPGYSKENQIIKYRAVRSQADNDILRLGNDLREARKAKNEEKILKIEKELESAKVTVEDSKFFLERLGSF